MIHLGTGVFDNTVAVNNVLSNLILSRELNIICIAQTSCIVLSNNQEVGPTTKLNFE